MGSRVGFGQILTDLLKKTSFPAQSLTNQRASFFFHYYARIGAEYRKSPVSTIWKFNFGPFWNISYWNISYSKYKLRHFLNIFLQDQWEKLLAVSICCCIIYVCYKELAIAGCKCFWCYLMQMLDEVGFPTPISNVVCDGIMRPGQWRGGV